MKDFRLEDSFSFKITYNNECLLTDILKALYPNCNVQHCSPNVKIFENTKIFSGNALTLIYVELPRLFNLEMVVIDPRNPIDSIKGILNQMLNIIKDQKDPKLVKLWEREGIKKFQKNNEEK